MKALPTILCIAMLLLLVAQSSLARPDKAGFYLPDHIQEVSLQYKNIENLVLLPVTINDSIHVNLILDTGCRNLVLFGKRFQKLFQLQKDKTVQFSGLGSGKAISGSLSLDNTVSIDAVIGERIPVVIIPNQNLFGGMSNIHGVVGYDIFTKFEVELNPLAQRITFRPASTAQLSNDFTAIPIRISDSRPVIDCRVVLDENQTHVCDLMIDTGSTLGLLLKTTDLDNYSIHTPRTTIGRGLNGIIEGFQTTTDKLQLGNLEISDIATGIIQSKWHNHASIGMEVLKNYAIVLNYCKGYAGFRRV